MTYKFSDSWELVPALMKLLPEGDPLRNSEFFNQLAGELEHVQDAEGYDAAYDKSVAALPEELRENMPAGFQRTILLAMCSDRAFLTSWARDHADFVVMSKLGPTVLAKFMFWPPHWWPLSLGIYIPLVLGFIGGALAQVYGPSVVVPIIQIGLVIAYLFLCVAMAVLCMIVFGLLAYPLSLLFSLIVHGIDAMGDLGRVKTIERTKTRRLKLEERRAQREARNA